MYVSLKVQVLKQWGKPSFFRGFFLSVILYFNTSLLSDANILCTFTILIKNWFYTYICIEYNCEKKTHLHLCNMYKLYHSELNEKHLKKSYFIVNILFLICFLNLHTAFFSWIRKKVKDDNQSLFIFRFLVVCQSFVECGLVSKSYIYSAREDHLIKV